MKYRAVFALSALCWLSSIAGAQTSTSAATQTATASGIAGGAYSVSVGNMPFGAGVTGAPYFAEQVQEQVQTLSDGTHITQTQPTQKMWRDSAGRTRTEQTLGIGRRLGPGSPPAPVFIQITDPVQGVRYVLDTQSKVAHRTSTTGPPRAVTEVRNAAGQAVGTGGGAGFGTGSGGGSRAPLVQAAPIREYAPTFASEDLGTQIIEGVAAQGHRRTTTYPANAFGNDRPVVTTSEVWTSTDLRVTVLSKSSDPRSGETTMRLTNISRVEPDPALFQPPPDYRIEEQTGNSVTMFPAAPLPPAGAR
jgi:hypothetical protein